MYFTWWRMPEEEFNVYHRFIPYFILGQLDYTKEVLIPTTKVINGQKVDGYNVINPLYCYEGGKFSFKNAFAKEDYVNIERAAIIVNRGWIPAHLKDKRSRPNEINTRKLVKLRGVFRKGKGLHDYKIPNNPDNNEWHNLALEDIGIYWDLPNWDEAKFYYFELVNLDQGEASNEGHNQVFP
jgi:cytochrome oxidase assembly protein ShyY1